MHQTDPERIGACFRRSIKSYDRSATVQAAIGNRLVALIKQFCGVAFCRVLEVGCGTGLTTGALCRHAELGLLCLNDLVPECCERAAEKAKNAETRCVLMPGNIETVQPPPDLDLIFSSSTFQWLSDLPGCLAKFHDSLNPGGYLVFSMLGPKTMFQVRALTGVGLSYPDQKELKAMMHHGFVVDFIEAVNYTLFFPTPREVLRHIRETGVGGVAPFRWTRSRLKRFEQRYNAFFSDQRGVALDYSAIFAVARKNG
ncbi:methyltransferase domain-containing protein [Desulforhopalus singaporensis]|uniref:Malonyl-[acyl-carrier protein] O-methyltransferase n=1 Tax=Desulforhopalus singaporensis TaxID=91360 RepID=A0A1H0VE26_9BACT|nr:methyltransferase domain-containing protein [Desulforhopalus singaporensis]SDP76727.1 malonyl-CoA O-methyltransferase [Desulforhopalus singaporensis]